MINIAEDIRSLTEFKKDTNKFIDDLKHTGRPAVLTVNGKAEIVVISASAFQEMQERYDLHETISDIEDSFKDFESGKVSEAKNVFTDIKRRVFGPKTIK